MPTTDPRWYKDAVIYEVHVRAFHDSIGDGFGDFRGLTRKLDYLEDLGVTAIWILPFYPSPLKDDGYDISDYTSIHPQYGKLEDFKEFLTEAHRRGIRVITELVINHTSDQHPWFQRARLSPKGSPERDFYVWSDTPDKYADARIIFKDFEPSNWSWDPVAKQYYWHRFYNHQPDLNYDNPAVWNAIFPVVDFWFELGVDGMRLDAVPYLYEREGTNCENLPETHGFLKALRAQVEKRFPDRMFVAEANQWPEEAVTYFGNGDECHMCFHFPVMPRLFMALHQEDRFPILDILDQTPQIPDNCQWCLFLRNHDELTLEMVTDEERDYMYRAYTQDRQARINLGIRHRLAPLLKNDRRRIELMNALLFSLPGTPVVYYGDEIGMGDNIYLGDRNGVRTPMQWSADRNAGFSRANPQKLFLPIIIDPEYHYEAVNVEAQQNNPSSLLWWMKRLISLRKQFKAFGRGTIRFLRPDNSKVLAFIREYQDKRILVVANLSRFVQFVELDLREYAEVVPEEVFGRTPFPKIGELPYLLTLSPHAFYWFVLKPAPPGGPAPTTGSTTDINLLPWLPVNRPLASHFERHNWDDLEALIPTFLRRRKIAPGRGTISAARLLDVFPVTTGETEVWFLIARLEFRTGTPEKVSIPLTLVPETELPRLLGPVEEFGFAVVGGPTPGVLCQALAVPACARAVLNAILSGKVAGVADHELVAVSLASTEPIPSTSELPLALRRSDRDNTAVVYDELFIYKSFRRVEDGVNPDLEIGRALTRAGFAGIAPVAGYVEYRRRGAESSTLGILHKFIPNQGTGWQYTLDQLSSYFERVAALSREHPPAPPSGMPLIGSNENGPSAAWHELIGNYLETVRSIARRTAELHSALARVKDPAFTPEPFGKLYQRSLYQSMRNLIGRLSHRLARERNTIPPDIQPLAEQLISAQTDILKRFRAVLDPALGGFRIRCHSDYHLGQLLYTGKEFVVIDFEGEPARPIGERRLKRSSLRDVAAMVRSFDYAVQSVFFGLASSRGRSPGLIRVEDRGVVGGWATAWYNRVAHEYVTEYISAMIGTGLLPSSEEHLSMFLELLILEKALQEIDLELTHRPDWLGIPLRGALRVLGCDLNDPLCL
ncbi:MAG: maltose alpha-D-glucosyltransferase [Planctomycetia bacterium]|nr:maltose alpha-D-glucosyltransferase [Planctomycetia bacterium]